MNLQISRYVVASEDVKGNAHGCISIRQRIFRRIISTGYPSCLEVPFDAVGYVDAADGNGRHYLAMLGSLPGDSGAIYGMHPIVERLWTDKGEARRVLILPGADADESAHMINLDSAMAEARFLWEHMGKCAAGKAVVIP